MPTAEEFLTDFAKDLIAHPANRPEIIKGWARHLEAREHLLKVTV